MVIFSIGPSRLAWTASRSTRGLTSFVCRTWLLRREASSTAATDAEVSRDTQPVGWSSPWAQKEEGEHSDHLDPTPDSYTSAPFADQCSLSIRAGSGGHGCISFLREKYIADGPANGGDGGTGGSVFIQAVKGETSLHKLARRGILSAGRGKNGRGSTKGGERGADVLIQVPVGTIVREVSRMDPVEEEIALRRRGKGFGRDAKESDDGEGTDQMAKWRRDKWILYPGSMPRSFTTADFPALPRPRRSNLSASQPKAPIRLDLDTHMDTPILLAAGAMGGLGNPHFVTKSITRPKYATRGELGMTLELHLELKILADVGLVGLPNAGKSTLLRSLTRSRARVGNWAFTTLQPNVGTVVLDDFKSRPFRGTGQHAGTVRESFMIADIPGLIEGAHLDKGLGLGFLRHVERAALLAFVVDLSRGDPVTTLRNLWGEMDAYQTLRERQVSATTERRFDALSGLEKGSTEHASSASSIVAVSDHAESSLIDSTDVLDAIHFQPVSAKPWFVVATKADLPETRENFLALQKYLAAVQDESEPHPNGRRNAWRQRVHLVPVSAIRAEGVDKIIPVVVDLLNSRQ